MAAANDLFPSRVRHDGVLQREEEEDEEREEREVVRNEEKLRGARYRGKKRKNIRW